MEGQYLLTSMSKPVGGRGIKAPYETTHVRVPVPIKPNVERFIEDFKNGVDNLTENPLTDIENALITAQTILKQKKSAKVSLEKLLTAIYNIDVKL
jgi:hypothetical protein